MMTKDFLKETGKEYIEKYPSRLVKFMEDFEAEEDDYIIKEMDYFENTLHDLENAIASDDGYSITGIENFSIARMVALEIGWDKFFYATQRKIKFLKQKRTVQNQFTENRINEPNKNIIIQPKIIPTQIEPLFEILKVYFDEERYADLRGLLETGYKTESKLLFKGTGIKLTDAFKQLEANNMIIVTNKTELRKWIVQNFQFVYNGLAKDFNEETIEKNITDKDYIYKKPIFRIVGGIIQPAPEVITKQTKK